MKKILHYIAPRFLAAGASLTIGLLSFGGTLALVSSLPLAIAGFVLSTVYEGEIYLQNIKRALKKLFKLNHLERQVARDYLLDQVEGVLEDDAPAFFKDYKACLRSVHPNKKKLSHMEKWFALQLFSRQQNPTFYQQYLHAWLDQQPTNEQNEHLWEERRRRHQARIRFVPAFCMVAGVFMGLGTSYLLVDAFLTIPMLAALPAAVVPMLIVPMALIAGAAYGFLIYNATTDMIANDTIGTWISDIKKDWTDGKYVMAVVFVFMLTLSVALSLCTAGTWWTVAKTTPPLFAWMGKMPSWIMLRVNPFISSVSTLIFNAQNISETLDMAKPNLQIGLLKLSFNPINPINPMKVHDNQLERLLNSKPAYVLFDSKIYYIDMSLNQVGRLNKQLLPLQNKSMAPFQAIFPQDVDVLQCASENHLTRLAALTRGRNHSFIASVRPLLARQENSWQRSNPFQFLVRLTFDPLRQLLFLGHLTSVSAVADRVPGVSACVSAFLGFINELFEDFHYFLGGEGHQHKKDLPSLIKERRDAAQGHDHGNDLPTQLLWMFFHVLYVPAALWDWGFSHMEDTPSDLSSETGSEDSDDQANPREGLDFWTALERQRGLQKNEVCCEPTRLSHSRFVSTNAPLEFEDAIYRIERYKEKELKDVWFDQKTASEQCTALTALQDALGKAGNQASYAQTDLSSVVSQHLESYRETYNRQRFFGADTAAVLNQLPSVVASRAFA